MQIKKFIILLLVFSVLQFTAFSLLGEDEKDKEKSFYGNFLFGYRMIDSSGSPVKYKEDINLDQGARLFNFSLHFIPTDTMKKYLDRLDISIYNYGGDPFEAMGINIQKIGRYKFKYDRKKSIYFYNDQYLNGNFDMHSFNFDRVMDTALFKISLHNKADLYFSFDRYTKEGKSITTLSLNRIEFELDKPIHEDYKDFTLGANVHLNRYTFTFEEKIQEYENSNSLFLPGYADGGETAQYPSSLNYFYIDQPYNLKSKSHFFKVTARPIDSLLINGAARLFDQDMELEYNEDADGVNYLNRFFNYHYSGTGTFDRDIQMYDADITLLLTNRLAFIGAARASDFEQKGTMTVDNNTQIIEWNYNTLGYEGGLQYQFTPGLSLTAGYRNETRELEDRYTSTYEQETKRTGFFGNFALNSSRKLSLNADYYLGNFDNPYTLISPTDFNRFKLKAKVFINNLSFSGSLLASSSKSEIFQDRWESSRRQLTFRAGYTTEKLKLFAGYSYLSLAHDADRKIEYPPGWSGPAGFFPWLIDYEGNSNLLDGSLTFKLNLNWTIGSYANIYINSGFWEISRTMFKTYLEYLFDTGYVAQLGYRYINFEEKAAPANDYDVHILELSLGYRWK
jgi:hypothetical protein